MPRETEKTMIYGYAQQPSVCQGDNLDLRVMTHAAQFSVDIYGADSVDPKTLRLTQPALSSIWPGPDPNAAIDDVDFLDFDTDWSWPKFEIPLDGLSPGLYVAVLWELDEQGNLIPLEQTQEWGRDGSRQLRTDSYPLQAL